MLILRKEAKEDIEKVYRWYQGQREGLGLHFLAEMERLLECIRSSPQHYPLIDTSIRRALCRRFPYAVYFLRDDSRVTVLACLHQRRHPAAWNRRD